MALPVLPNNWQPRDYQRPLWNYLEKGGRRAVGLWHRRAGKDEVCLHWAAVSAMQRQANYWHMLPEASQARKAIWEAVNPKTGLRRIDEAFPQDIRATTREQEMMIRFRNGSTWQVVGSDNFNSLVGAPPAGVVLSEWSLANPAAWAFLRPILAENGGWALFIYTPRGKNHGYNTFNAARKEPAWFCQKLIADQTKVFEVETLAEERRGYIEEYGDAEGEAYFQQEYYCSFDAAILGAVYGQWIAKAEAEGRVTAVPYDRELPVHTAWDLGYDDATAIWFFQVARSEVRIIDYFEANRHAIDFYIDVLKEKPYRYGQHHVPHDAANKLMAAGGRSIVEQAMAKGVMMNVVPATSQQNGIEAARRTLSLTWFNDTPAVQKGLEPLRQYQFEYDQNKRTFHSTPRHDWTSHAADAFEIIGQVWQKQRAVAAPPPRARYLHELTAAEVFKLDEVEVTNDYI